jgi:hypothetical protein
MTQVCRGRADIQTQCHQENPNREVFKGHPEVTSAKVIGNYRSKLFGKILL